MTDIELLPLPIGAEILGRHIVSMTLSDLEAYARANVEHHTEKLRTEIEALKQDLDQYRDAALKEHEHAERLAAALRHMVSEAIDGGHSYMMKAIKDSGASALLRDRMNKVYGEPDEEVEDA